MSALTTHIQKCDVYAPSIDIIKSIWERAESGCSNSPFTSGPNTLCSWVIWHPPPFFMLHYHYCVNKIRRDICVLMFPSAYRLCENISLFCTNSMGVKNKETLKDFLLKLILLSYAPKPLHTKSAVAASRSEK